MKPYIKPTFEFVELRPEERLANCSNGNGHGNSTCVNINGNYTGHSYDSNQGPGNGNAYGHQGLS